MHFKRFSLLTTILFSLLFTANSFAAKVDFKEYPTRLRAPVAEAYEIQLRDLLAEFGSGTLGWEMVKNPDWIHINDTDETLWGTPPNVGQYQWRLIVYDLDSPGGGSEPGAITDVIFTVTNPPKWKTQRIDLGIAPEDSSFTFDLKTEVDNPTGAPITFSAENLPGWLNIDTSTGILSGKPLRPDVGPFDGITFTLHSPQESDRTAEGYGEVVITLDYPKWNAAQFTIDNATEDSDYEFDVSGDTYIFNPEGFPLTFDMVSGPQWLQVTANNGSLFGMPKRPDVDAVQATVRFRATIDGNVHEDTTTFNFEVIQINKPPRWLTDPVILPDGFSGVGYSQDLMGSVTDPDGDTLTFRILSGPTWAKVSSNGTFSGTPQKPDVGINQWAVEVSDGQYQDVATVEVKVIKSNEPPYWLVKPTVLPIAQEDIYYSQDLTKHATDPDGDTMSFEKIDGPTWATVTQSGIMRGTPGKNDVGVSRFKVRVTDNISGSDTTDILIEVEHTNHKPEWTIDPIRFSVTEDDPMQKDISQYAVDSDGDHLVFSAIAGKPWAQLSAAGVFTGTPGSDDLGENFYEVVVDDGNGGTASVTVIITVIHVNHAPYWTEDPITLPDATEDSPYSQSVASYAKDPDVGDTLTFAKVNGPSWINVGSNGAITGTPHRPDVGPNTFQVRVSDQVGENAVVTVNLKVIQINKAPKWLQDPIDLGKALEDAPFTFDLAPLAEDPDGDALTFAKVDGPAWLTCATNGRLTGTPGAADLGNFGAIFRVSDGHLSADVKATGEVVHVNHAPYWTGDPIILPQATEDSPYNQSVATYAKDDDGDALTFEKIDGPDWISVSTAGDVTGTPRRPNVGLNTFHVRVKDPGNLSANTTFLVTVLQINKPPIWLEDPIDLGKVLEETQFTFDLAPLASDPDGNPITFSMVNGPDWLTCAPDGKLTGVPQSTDVGNFTATFRASDGVLYADAGAFGEVIHVNEGPYWIEDPITLPNAPELVPYSQNISDYAKDDDGDPLTFEKLDGPAWILLGSDGAVTGTPQHTDLGLNTFHARVKDPAGLFADVTVNVTVVKVNNAPVWIDPPIDLGQAIVDQPYSFDLKPHVSDPDGDPLTITLKSGPTWLTISSDGVLIGTPAQSDLGDFNAQFIASDGQAQSEATGIGKVVEGNHAPYWIQDPITMIDGKVNKAYTEPVSQFAKDPDNDPLAFSKISGPDWVFVTSSGLVIGTPSKADLGVNSLVVRAQDPTGLYADATAVITVFDPNPNQPPVWLEDPIPLGIIQVGQDWQFDLNLFASDPDGDRLTFKMINGPIWFTVSPDGKIIGEPQAQHLGEFTAIFEVSDGEFAVQAGGFGRVEKGGDNLPPVFVPEALSFILKANTVTQEDIDDPNYIYDPDGDPMTFELTTPVDWVTLSPAGLLVMSPLNQHVGQHTFTVKATDDKGAATSGPLYITVLKDGKPPIWLENPILMEARVDTPFAASVANKATDENTPPALPLTFSIVSDPNWLTMASDGNLRGTPLAQHEGPNTYILRATNTIGLYADATLVVTVKKGGDQTDKTQVDKAVPGAPAEQLWVVDNGPGSWALMNQLSCHIGVFYEALERAQIHYTNLMINSRKCHGTPLVGKDGDILFDWNNSNIVSEFRARLKSAWVLMGCNSPIYRMYEFYQKAPGISEIFENGFFMKGVPFDTLFLTRVMDYYQYYSRGTPIESWGPRDYVDNYIGFHAQQKQPYRLSGVTPMCGTGTGFEEDPEMTGFEPPDGAYEIIIQATQGTHWKDSTYDMEKILLEYANQVIFRAYAHAKKRVPLTKVPSDPNTIKVSIGALTLSGNTGSPDDQWAYDAINNEVILYWHNIPMTDIKPGDFIVIEYKY